MSICSGDKEDADNILNGEYVNKIEKYFNKFYEKQASNAKITTSMPLVGDVLDKWNEILKDYDEIVYIPMSSGLSSSCETAMIMAEDFDDKVQVVNNRRISVTQKLAAYEAKRMADEGKGAKEIKEYLEKRKT